MVLASAAGLVTVCTTMAQSQPPSALDPSPTVNTEISSLIQTGSGYDAWTGSVRREVTDLEVPGAVSSLGLKWVRTYNSSSNFLNGGWSFSWTWRYWGRGWPDTVGVRLPDGGIWRTNETGTKLQFWRSCAGGRECGNGDAFLTLEDGSKVHMSFYVDFPDDIHPVDHFIPDYVDDPYGRRTTLQYEDAIPNQPDSYLRLKRVTDPSGKWINITYACNAGNCTTTDWYKVTHVEGSNGAYVDYTWIDATHLHVSYSDGSTADYTYGTTNFLEHTVCGCNPNCVDCYPTFHTTSLITAQDTHANSPIQAIRYDYSDPGLFSGQVSSERHLTTNALVSTRTCDTCPTPDWSGGEGRQNATITEIRGDGPSRTLYIEKGAQRVPLVKRKSDFNGINEVFTYDSNNYLLTAQDRNGNVTTYTNEQLIGNPTQILYQDGKHIDYTYYQGNPYHVHTVTNE
jgi:hypothetical protein